jgi:hypothetical protein
MKDLGTGINLPSTGQEILYGDVLMSNQTHDVVVMYHKEKRYILFGFLLSGLWSLGERLWQWIVTLLFILKRINYESNYR